MSRVFVSKIDSKLDEKVLASLEWIGWETIVQPNSKILIKPNFTFPVYKAGVTTSPLFLETLVMVLKKRCNNITIGETDGGYYAWKAEEAFLNHKLYEIKKKYNVNLVNLYDSEIEHINLRVNSREYIVPLPKILLRDIDVFISVPVLKVHSMTDFSFGLKNQWGIILDPFRMRYHHVFKETVLKINELLPAKIMIADPFYILTEKGPMDGKVIPFNTIITSDDIFAFEKVGCEILGVEIKNVDYLSYAESLGKIPSSESLCFNVPIKQFYTHQYKIRRTFKDKLTQRIFKSSLLTYLLYYSKFGILLHKIYYFFTGKKNKIKLSF